MSPSILRLTPAAALLALSLAACQSANPYASIKQAVPETPANNPVLKERGETPEQHDARMLWFRDARFGMFIHWGLYAQAGGEWKGKFVPPNNGCQEWIMHTARIPISDYAAQAKDFNPVKYDAEKWVLAAKDAGVKYIVITSKHHEGFAMFHSKASPYNIVNATPFGRDPLKELAAACRKHGMKLGFYYSQNLDWHHAGGGSGEWDPAHQGDPGKYVEEIVLPQVREILSNYGDISVVWWDIPGGVINRERADRIHAEVLRLAPHVILNNRLGGGYHSDIETPEQHIPPTGFPGRDWESCMTMNGTWGFSKFDHNWKSPKTLLRNLCDIASKGGNYLLNVGPTPQGEIPAPSLERLAVMGAWLKQNGEAIYGTRASVFPKSPSWGRTTTRRLASGDTRLYAIVFNPPQDGVLKLENLANTAKGASLLVGGQKIAFQSTPDGLSLTLPETLRTQEDFVVAIDLAGAPNLDPAIRPEADGAFRLSPRRAALTGSLALQGAASAGLSTSGGESLASWINPQSTAAWQVKSAAAERVAVKLWLAAPASSAGSELELACGDQVLKITVPATGQWNNFQEVSAGTLNLPAGTSGLTLRCKSVKGQAPCNVGDVWLTPAK